MTQQPLAAPYETSRYRAYLSEPITRCPQREKSRIKTLVDKLAKALIQRPYETSLYVPSLFTSPEKRASMRPEHVYLLDRIRVVQADFLLVIADHTSFGIGGEVEIGTSLGKPIIFISRAKKLSRFLIGSPANATRAAHPNAPYFLAYRDWWDLRPKLFPIIEAVLGRLSSTETEQLPLWDLGDRLKTYREKSGLTHQELGHRTGLLPVQLALWEQSIERIREELAAYQEDGHLGLGPIELTPRQVEQLVGVGIDALHRLSFSLDVSVGELIGETQKYLTSKGPAKVSQTMRRQLYTSRLESLKLRAAQFDITFREFQNLEKSLVKEFLDKVFLSNPAPARALGIISEREFSDALRELREKVR